MSRFSLMQPYSAALVEAFRLMNSPVTYVLQKSTIWFQNIQKKLMVHKDFVNGRNVSSLGFENDFCGIEFKSFTSANYIFCVLYQCRKMCVKGNRSSYKLSNRFHVSA